MKKSTMTKDSSMKPANPRILTINGGSSSIKFALFEADDPLRRILEGGIERIGLPETTLRVKGMNPEDNYSRLLTAPNHAVALNVLMDWIEECSWREALGGLDTLVFAGGIGENAPTVRSRICDGLGFLGIELAEKQNVANAGVISTAGSHATVRVICTDEELMIAKTVFRVLGPGVAGS